MLIEQLNTCRSIFSIISYSESTRRMILETFQQMLPLSVQFSNVMLRSDRSERVDFLIEMMISFFEKQKSQKESINSLPLYPIEQIMWDESVVPNINYSEEGYLALPKLNLQFLPLHDYMLIAEKL